MTSKEKILRKIWLVICWLGKVIYWISLLVLIFLFVTGNGTIFSNVILGINAGLFSLKIFSYIHKKLRFNNVLKIYKKLFRLTKYIHGLRYQAYLNANQADIKECTDSIEDCVKVLLKVGTDMMQSKSANKNERKELQAMIEEAKTLRTTILPH